METFSRRLKECREKLKADNSKWTQGYVAEKLSVARTTYTAYENGTKTPPLDTVNKIANLFNVSADYLLGRTEDLRTPYEEDFQKFINDPELKRWHRELPKTPEEDLRKLRKMWEIMKEDKN